VEHWSNAVGQAAAAAHNMVCAPSARRPHRLLPAFWSNQFGVNIKSIGLPAISDEVVVTQGTVAERRFAAAYGRRGRLVAAVTVNMSRWLEAYRALIEDRAPFPPQLNAADGPAELHPIPAGFPARGQPTHSSVTASCPGPSSSPECQVPAPPSAAPDPRLPPSATPLDDDDAAAPGRVVPAPHPAARPAEARAGG
jgi:3-phenylpropionate/trans-cinnamate dioxygenase ferredoxin reductase subunit